MATISLHLKLFERGYITKVQCAAMIGFLDAIQDAEGSYRVAERIDAIQAINRVSANITAESKAVLAALLAQDTLSNLALTLGCAPKRIGFLVAKTCDELITLLEGRTLRTTGPRTMDILPVRSCSIVRNTQAGGSPAARKAFRASLQWRKMRYDVLADNAERNGGLVTCELCLSSMGSMHVDHIEALSKNFDRRLDKSNLQVLCKDCNIGKLDGPAADFRTPAPSASDQSAA